MLQRWSVWAGASAIVLVAGGAVRADRMAQAGAVFADSCARCHSAESLRPKTMVMPQAAAQKSALDRVKSTVNKPAPRVVVDPVRTWITDPITVNPNTLCEAGRMDPMQRELLVSFLRRPQNPLTRSFVVATIAAQYHGIAPKPEKPGPKMGQGDHR